MCSNLFSLFVRTAIIDVLFKFRVLSGFSHASMCTLKHCRSDSLVENYCWFCFWYVSLEDFVHIC